MMKIFGGLIVIAASAGIGYLTGLDYQKYLDELRYLRLVMMQLKGEIGYTRGALSEVTGRLSNRVREPYRSWLLHLSEALEERSEATFSRIWTASIDSDLKSSFLTAEDMEDLKQTGINLGYLDAAMQIGILELYMERLELKIQQIQAGVSEKRRVWNCLGLLGGIFLTIMLV